MGSLENMETGEVFALSPSTRVGRGAANELSLDDREVSTLHAFIEWRGGFWRLRDLGSTNGTMVDDRRADGGPLSTGQVVQFGSPAQRWQVISVRPPRARALPVGGAHVPARGAPRGAGALRRRHPTLADREGADLAGHRGRGDRGGGRPAVAAGASRGRRVDQPAAPPPVVSVAADRAAGSGALSGMADR